MWSVGMCLSFKIKSSEKLVIKGPLRGLFWAKSKISGPKKYIYKVSLGLKHSFEYYYIYIFFFIKKGTMVLYDWAF